MDSGLLLTIFGVPAALGAIATPVAIVLRGRRSGAEVASAITDGTMAIAKAAQTLPDDALPRSEHAKSCVEVNHALQWSGLLHEAVFKMLLGRVPNTLELQVLAGEVHPTDSMLSEERRPEERVGRDVKYLIDAITHKGGIFALLQRRLPMGPEAMTAAMATAPVVSARVTATQSLPNGGQQNGRTSPALLMAGGDHLPTRAPGNTLTESAGNGVGMFTVPAEQRRAQLEAEQANLARRVRDSIASGQLDLNALWRLYCTYLSEVDELWTDYPGQIGRPWCEILEDTVGKKLGLTPLPGMDRFPDYMTTNAYRDWDKAQERLTDGD